MEFSKVASYTGLNILQINELPLSQFLLLLRDNFIMECNKSEAGQTYLEECYLLQQTTPDRKRLRKTFGKEGGN